MVPEAYRQKFRNCKKENEQTHVEFARTIEQLFDRWCSSKKIGSDHEKLRQLMLVEEFKWCINSDIKSFLDEKQVETLEAAARLADDYALTHKVSFINKSNPSRRPFFPQSGFKHGPINPPGSYSQTLSLADTLPFSEKTSSGTSVLIQGVECGFVNVPLHNIYLSSDLVTGLVAVGIRPSLPFKGVHLLLGNDLAGDKVVVNPLLTNIPCIDQPPDPIEQEIPDLYPSCAVTRAMVKKAKQNDGDIDLTDTFLGSVF